MGAESENTSKMCYRVIACILLAAFVANALTESEMEVPESTEMSSEIFAQETANAGLWRRRRGSGKRSKGGKAFLHKFIKRAAHKFHTGFVKKNEVEKTSSCKNTGGTVAHYLMKTTTSNKQGTKKKGAIKKDDTVTEVVMGFHVKDVASGCMVKQVLDKRRYKQLTYRNGVFKEESKKYHMMAHWLRYINLVSYAGETKQVNKKSKTTSRSVTPAKSAAAMLQKLNCKLGFLQSKDGLILSIFHSKNASKDCVKIKTQMAEAFESYYFQNGLKQYHALGRYNGMLTKQRITVKTKHKELMRVCRKTARSARKAKVGPGGHKGKPGLKVNKGSLECCNDYNRYGVMTKSRCFMKQRPGRGGMKKLTSTGGKPGWRKKMHTLNKKRRGKKAIKKGHRTKKHMQKLKRKTLGRRRRRSRRRRASLVQEALAPTFDVSADQDLENFLTVTSQKGKRKGNESHKKPTGSAMHGQPAVKGHGMSHIELVRSKKSMVLFQFSSEDDVAAGLEQHWRTGVQRAELGENYHSNKDGWEDVAPVSQQEFVMAAHNLDTNPTSKDTYNQLVDMYQRDHKAVDAVIGHAVKNHAHLSKDAVRVAVNALQGASDNTHAQRALARLITTPNFEEVAVATTHGIENPHKDILDALEMASFDGEGMNGMKCNSLLALGAAVGGMKPSTDRTRLVQRISKNALQAHGDECYVAALGNAASGASQKTSEEVMLQAGDDNTDEERRARLMASLTYMPDNRVDSFLLQQFSRKQKKNVRFLAAKVLAERQDGRTTEKAIDGVADLVQDLPETDDFTMGVKGIYRARLKSFHSPASMRLLLVHAERGYVARGKALYNRGKAMYGKAMAKLNKFKNSGFKLNPRLSMSKCMLYNNLKGKLSCERGIVKCVSIGSKKLGCIGGSAYAYLDYAWKIAGLNSSANARAAAGMRLEFFKWGVVLFDTDNKVGASKKGGNMSAYAKYFNIRQMKMITIYQVGKEELEMAQTEKSSYLSRAKGYANKAKGYYNKAKGIFNQVTMPGSICKANQKTKFNKEKTVSKTFFSVSVCYGLPKIASICGTASFTGSLGIRAGFGIIKPTYTAMLMNIEPSAGIGISITVSGSLLGFTGYVKGHVDLITVALPASAIAEYWKIRAGGFYLGWNVNLLKATLSAGVKFSLGGKCKTEEVPESQMDVVSPPHERMRVWGIEQRAANEELMQANSQSSSQASVGFLWRRRRRGRGFFGGIWHGIKKVAKVVVKVVKKVVKFITKCRQIYGPKTFLKFGGKNLSGNIIDKNINGGSKCSGKAAKPAPMKKPKAPKSSSRRRASSSRRSASSSRRRASSSRRRASSYRRRRASSYRRRRASSYRRRRY